MSTQTKAETIGNKLIRHWTSGTLVTADLSEAGEAVARLEAENAGLREQNTMLDEKLAEMEAQPLQPPVAQPDHLRDATKMMQPAKPLTDEQIDALIPYPVLRDERGRGFGGEGSWDRGQVRKVARAIEAAHGITATREHVTDDSQCWCNPEITYTDPDTGVSVIVHKEPQ